MATAEAFDRFAAALDYPVFAVTACGAGERAGCLVGFATQSSVNPPIRFVVCISRQNHTQRVASEAEYLAVHVIPADRRDLAELFGSRTGDDTDKFAACRWEPGPGGTPLLTDCPSRFVGRVVGRFDGGDHEGVVLEVAEAWSSGDVRPLTFHEVRDLEPGHRA
jgi:flavin reductase (DIM6/NTAB) family NADH-FMN oxidoreductase RutF